MSAETRTSAEIPRPKECLAALVERIDALAIANGEAPHIVAGEILAVIGRRAFGPLLLAIGLFSISPATIVPGMTWLTAGIVLVLAIQMMFGARHPWLPGPVLAAAVSPALVRAIAQRARPWAQRIDAILKPRLSFLSEPPFINIAGALVALAALATFPLGLFPAAPLAPGITIVVLGVGLTTRDGLVLLLSGLFVFGALALAYFGVVLSF